MTAIPYETPGALDEHSHAHHTPFLKKYIFSTDHKIIGIQFLILGLSFLLVGGIMALLVRWQLAWPNTAMEGFRPVPLLGKMLNWSGGAMPPDFYNFSFTAHATLMIFFAVIPLLVGVFGNYLIPLKIGAPDMAFPFLNGVTFWTALPAGAIMFAGFHLTGAANAAGWTSYPPLSALLLSESPWPGMAVLITFIAFTLCYLFLASYTIQLGHWTINTLVSLALALGLAYFTVRGVQNAAFDFQSAWFLSLILLGFSSIMGSVNYIATVIKLRCPGMTMFRLPLSVWSLFITAILVLLATPVLASALTLNLLDHHRLTTFFLTENWAPGNQPGDAAGGGYPLLHQHLFWFYSHPAVYIMILPAMGMVSDILPVFARKPIFGYRPMVYAMGAIAFLGFIVWAHHMFQSGMNATLGTTFAISTMFIAVPSAIKTFNWLGTLWGGNIRFATPLLHAVAFVSMFVIGGLSGIFMASPPVDVHIHDSYFIVAHIHYVLFGGSLFGIFAGISFWYPKMFGRMMSERLGKVHFWLTFVTFNCTFFPMHILGNAGFPRRIADYTHYMTFGPFYVQLNQFMTVSAIILGLAQVLFMINFLGSWFLGRRAPRNPWQAATLEWETASPPPHGNFEKTPVVYHGPYEYSSPLVEEDWLPQTKKVTE